jgi:hypothetical protein
MFSNLFSTRHHTFAQDRASSSARKHRTEKMAALDPDLAELDAECHRVENDCAGRNVNFNVTNHALSL